ncbi:amidohydrolase family protein [Pinisolibacter aquiterrae]|uniref:amidohydrolase family protein n=1 Tax=Pinisolibacter aquiterrae TaxID=2815579 RepID=UPI001C3C33EC|nr:amidohydrolase family protein [Pinisolibacter aquiterrae]MBV5263691.1 amidohydrolase [Pinisolibacter aquiterrae]MCC8235111.1 amidohydrolase [Pinisolibacter aquiterrae]
MAKIIDCHAHMAVPTQLPAYKAGLLSHRGAHGRGKVGASDDDIRAAFERVEMAPMGHMECLDKAGVDMQVISPRPYQMMHSEKPAKLVHWYMEEVNDLIARQCALYPGRFVPMAGLPQTAGDPIEGALPELERCVTKMGFRGCLINPDPYENSGEKAPPMGDRYWYPLYEKMCELDVVGHIHSASSRLVEREPYSLHFINEETTAVYGLIKSTVLDDFPELKIVVSHGGGAIPYQVGRFDSASVRRPPRFLHRLRRLYFDTVLYSREAIELLIKVVGPDHCVFGAEMPGVGSAINPETGETFDTIIPYIRDCDFITEDEKAAILGGNAMKLFKIDDE